ncbi:type II secretion system F family protein (plasmid) [Mycoplasmatota bacterium]|nr:type II secretion system F family protein [Mycoplasmatota bacterium]
MNNFLLPIILFILVIVIILFKIIDVIQKERVQQRKIKILDSVSHNTKKNNPIIDFLKNNSKICTFINYFKKHDYHSKRSYIFIINAILILIFASVLGFWYIGIFLGTLIYSLSLLENYLDFEKRRELFTIGFPSMIEYIMGYLEGGENIELAIEGALTLTDNPIIIEEFKQVQTDTKAFGDFLHALKLLTYRIKVKELDYFYRNLNSSVSIGVSMLDSLHSQTEYIHRLKNSRIKEKIGKLENTMVLVTALFAFLPNVLLILTPTIIDFMDNMNW